MQYLMIIISALMLAFAYRLRGGGFFTLGGDSQCRAVWGGALAITYLINVPFSIAWALAPWVFAMGWVGETVPHAFCQNMGRRAVSWYSDPIAKWWPGILIPEPRQSAYAASSYTRRYVCDALAMATVGGLRAALVLSASTGLALWQHNHATLCGAALAVAWRVLWQPVAYTLGWLVPLTLPSLAARSTEWAEFLDGAGWAAAWVILVMGA